jgi:hypothetical protein
VQGLVPALVAFDPAAPAVGASRQKHKVKGTFLPVTQRAVGIPM